jgi:hypothetical protein
MNKALTDHDWQTITQYAVDGRVNYFGKRHVSNDYIRRDMQEDERNYSSSHNILYPDTVTHEVSNEYSSQWTGPMLYDSITVYSEVRERQGRLHKALTRLTLGYTIENGRPSIYALALKAPGNQPL